MRKFSHCALAVAALLILLATVPGISHDSSGQDSEELGYTLYPASVYNNATIENVFEPGFVRFHDRISSPVPLHEEQIRD